MNTNSILVCIAGRGTGAAARTAAEIPFGRCVNGSQCSGGPGVPTITLGLGLKVFMLQAGSLFPTMFLGRWK